MKNKMTDLRNHLFATLEALNDKDKPMDVERAKAISQVAQTLINSAKVEIDLMKEVGRSKPTEFFEVDAALAAGRLPRIAAADPQPGHSSGLNGSPAVHSTGGNGRLDKPRSSETQG